MPPDAFASDGSALLVLVQRGIAIPTLPSRGKSAETFLQNHGSRVYRPSASPSRIRREKAGSCRMKNARRSFAFGSSQRNRMTLMFGAAPLLATRLKRFTQLRI
jgi:hypothetical protein